LHRTLRKYPSQLNIVRPKGGWQLFFLNDSGCQHVRKVDISSTGRTAQCHGYVRLFVSGLVFRSRPSTFLLIIRLHSVPAEYASFRLHDALLSRLSNDGMFFFTRFPGLDDEPGTSYILDSIEKSLSTFAAEMATSSMILGAFLNLGFVTNGRLELIG
jgi:hypothetical protein